MLPLHHDPLSPERRNLPGAIKAFKFTTGDFLNTLIVDVTPRYAISTKAGATTLWKVSGAGNLYEIARIEWSPPFDPRQTWIELADQRILATDLMSRSRRGLFHNSKYAQRQNV